MPPRFILDHVGVGALGRVGEEPQLDAQEQGGVVARLEVVPQGAQLVRALQLQVGPAPAQPGAEQRRQSCVIHRYCFSVIDLWSLTQDCLLAYRIPNYHSLHGTEVPRPLKVQSPAGGSLFF